MAEQRLLPEETIRYVPAVLAVIAITRRQTHSGTFRGTAVGEEE